MSVWLIGCSGMWVGSYLQDDGKEDKNTNAAHQAAVIGEEGLKAAPGPDVELLCAVVIVIMSRVIGQVVLDAGPGGPGVTAAEWDAVHQILPLHVTEDSTAGQTQVRGQTKPAWGLRRD